MRSLLIITLLLSGCAHYDNMVYMKDVQVNNYAPNNFVGNPCEIWLNDRCLLMKPQARNPDK